MLGLVEVLVGEDLEAEVAGFRLGTFSQHDAVMATFFQRAQIDGAAGLVGDLQAQRVDVEGARPDEVGDRQFDMAEAHDVERRIEVWCGQGHG